MARQQVNPVQLSGTNPGIHAKPLTGEQKAGVNLAYFLLIIISAVILIISSLFYFKELDATNSINNSFTSSTINNDSSFNRNAEQVKILMQEKKEYREFVMKNFQYILGVLLPILTSILGYIFGTKAKE